MRLKAINTSLKKLIKALEESDNLWQGAASKLNWSRISFKKNKNEKYFHFIFCSHSIRNIKSTEAEKIRSIIYELTEFLLDVLKIDSLPSRFPHRVGLHVSCYGQRGLHSSSMTEQVLPSFSKPEKLLGMIQDLVLVKPAQQDECCGFGDTFCVFEEAVSVKMGKVRINEHLRNENR